MAMSDRGELIAAQPRLFMFRLSIARLLAFFAIIVPIVLTSSATAQAVIMVSGTTFLDLNDNGTRDTRELGLGNVWVRAYDDTGTLAGSTNSSTATHAAGKYSLSLPPRAYRVEFDLSQLATAANYNPAAQGRHNSSSIVIVDGTTTIDFGVAQPTRFCQDNPNLVSTCHLPGNQLALRKPVIVSFPYNADSTATTPPVPVTLAEANEVGTTWGLVYQPSSQSMFASAFMKRHAGFHSANATGAIYIIPDANMIIPGKPLLFLDLNALLGAGTTGSDGRPVLPDYHRDTESFSLVGKVALGDLDLAEDGVGLWTVNLASRELYYIPIGLNATAPTSAAAIQRYPIPLTTAATADPTLCPSVDDARPFGIEPANGKVYVGLVCSAESTQQPTDLRALVYEYTVATQQFGATPVLNIPLNYQRGCIDHEPGAPFGCLPANPELLADWKPWPDTAPNFSMFDVGGYVGYPEPWLTDIVLDRGSMILALRDRFGDQSGYQELNPIIPDSANYTGFGAGDILRACPNTAGGWTIESNGQCGNLPIAPVGAGNGLGPDGGEYYSGDKNPLHNGITVGGLGQVPSSDLIAVTAYDPLPDTNYEGGVIWLNNDDGTRVRGYRVYGNRREPNADPRFAKANGMGDLLALCDAAPVEIGNRVWFDSNGDGVQQPSELPLDSVMVELVSGSGAVIGTATTDSNGHYYFSNDTRRGSTPSERYGITAIGYSEQYTIRIPLQQARLNTLYVTKQNMDTSTGGNTRDSDGDSAFIAAGINASADATTGTTFVIGAPGQNNHSYDFGFTVSPTAIALQRLSATLIDTMTQVSWATTAEQATFGFQIYRSDDATWEHAVLVTPQVILAQGGHEGASYHWADIGSPPTSQTRYWLVEVEIGGATHRYGPVDVANRLSESPYEVSLPLVKGP